MRFFISPLSYVRHDEAYLSDEGMEANAEQIRKEESRAARLAAQADKEEEENERKRQEEKRKRKLAAQKAGK